jgi:hypothetical protein
MLCIMNSVCHSVSYCKILCNRSDFFVTTSYFLGPWTVSVVTSTTPGEQSPDSQNSLELRIGFEAVG